MHKRSHSVLLMLTGLAGSGKDTIADYLVAHHGFHKFNFATTMKKVCARESQLDENFFYDRDKKDSPIRSFLPPYSSPPQFGQFSTNPEEITPRDLLISLAARTRKEDPDYWTKIVLNDIQREIKEQNWSKFVIADCRLHSEVAYMKKAGEKCFDDVSVVWITRSDIQNVQDNIQLSQRDADYTILNNETPFNGRVVDEFIQELNRKHQSE